MNETETKELLEIARVKLQNRPGLFEKFELEILYGLSGLAYALVQLSMFNDGAVMNLVSPDIRRERRHRNLCQAIDSWAARQPQPRPLKVEPLPPLPGTVEAVSASPAAPPLRSLRQISPPYILKKSALIDELSDEWPTIAGDLQEASRNGLKDEAHTGEQGKWDVEKARAWAMSRGKLRKKKEGRLPATPFTGLAR